MSGDDKETLQLTHQFSPHVELNPFNSSGKRIETPPDLHARFQYVIEGVYPKRIIDLLKQENYQPYMIGYDHPQNLNDLPKIKSQLLEIQSKHHKPLKVALEIEFAQLGYIKDFLLLEQEYKETGKIKGQNPKQKPEEYRQKLMKNHSENLALWLLDNGMEVISLENRHVRKWISEDKQQYPEEEDFFGEHEPIERQAYTAIKRDIHGLSIIKENKPDVIAAGTAHVFKYDLLLERSGQKSYYFLTSPPNWQRILNMWQQVHDEFRNKN